MAISQPLVDVIIPVHDVDRPVARAVRSVTENSGGERCRVTVVCHGVSSDAITDRLGDAARSERVRLIEFADGIPSPAGPFNFGVEAASADFVCRLDSDDQLEPGAMAAWTRHADAHRPDVLLARMRPVGAEPMKNPLTRPFRRNRLDPVRDRLAYRTAPLGLIKRATIERLQAKMTQGLRTGEDLDMGLRLWFLSDRVDIAGGSPCYLIGDDAPVRATNTKLPVAEELRAAIGVAQEEWVARLPRRSRAAVATKLLRTSVFGAVFARPSAAEWSDDSVLSLRRATALILEFSGDAVAALSRAERRLLDDTRAAGAAADIVTALARFTGARVLDRLVTRRLIHTLGPDTTLRRYVRYRLPG